ncbi:1febf056-33d6-4dce-847d-76ce4d045619 [Thermothielavioides terrestris]|uniref:1febf056-33d6-4dce-847d-76ce4d045619 n=1 Tax=Thermothielavioides terrestris TaxID=2587410 RepID=A0A446B8A4_9PEZI|nr:1febf056-33d6-4dce-847d-76ce4d045619 [Thermothielavioides terrestris]
MGFPGLLITGLNFLSTVANILALIGCISPSTKDIALFRANVTLVANGLHDLAALDSGNETEVPRSSELPTYWYWGMSGICDVYNATGETRCRRTFPPTANLLSIVQDSLRDRFGDDHDQLTISIVASWNATLNSLSPGRLVAKEGLFVAESRARSALAILSIPLDFLTIPRALCAMRRDSSSRSISVPPLLSALVTAAAGVLAVLSTRSGVQGAVSTGEKVGTAVIILFVAASLRAVSAAAALVGAARSDSSSDYGILIFKL